MEKTVEFANMKDAVVAAIMDLAEEHEDVVVLDADLASCIGTTAFQQKYPERFFDCGIAEANMIGVAAGLSSMGFTPFVHSFGCFASRRVYDQLFISVGYAKQTVHVIGSDPGVTAQYNGGTHMPFEDIALMRQIPGMVIIEPSDVSSCYDLICQVYCNKVPSYIRTPRKGAVTRYALGTAVLGKGIEIFSGGDVALVATGSLMVEKCCEAVKLLHDDGISATLVDLHTIRPLDTSLILDVAKRCKGILVCENGRYAGGVGEMIAGYLADKHPVRMGFVNVGECFGEVGDLDYLCNRFGFTPDSIAEKAKKLIT